MKKTISTIAFLSLILPSFVFASPISCAKGDLFDIATGKACGVSIIDNSNSFIATLQVQISRLEARIAALEAKVFPQGTGTVTPPTDLQNQILNLPQNQNPTPIPPTPVPCTAHTCSA